MALRLPHGKPSLTTHPPLALTHHPPSSCLHSPPSSCPHSPPTSCPHSPPSSCLHSPYICYVYICLPSHSVYLFSLSPPSPCPHSPPSSRTHSPLLLPSLTTLLLPSLTTLLLPSRPPSPQPADQPKRISLREKNKSKRERAIAAKVGSQKFLATQATSEQQPRTYKELQDSLGNSESATRGAGNHNSRLILNVRGTFAWGWGEVYAVYGGQGGRVRAGGREGV